MNYLKLIVLFAALVVPAVAQNPGPVPMAVPDPYKAQLDLSQTKMENLGLKANTLNSQLKAQMADLENQYNAQNAEHDRIVKEARTFLKLGDNAVYDAKTFTFVTPAPTPAAPGAVATPATPSTPVVKK